MGAFGGVLQDPELALVSGESGRSSSRRLAGVGWGGRLAGGGVGRAFSGVLQDRSRGWQRDKDAHDLSSLLHSYV